MVTSGAARLVHGCGGICYSDQHSFQRNRPLAAPDAKDMEGVNHCSSHCRLAKFRGVMYQVKYGAVIG